jgi:hypothetical protein
MDDWASPNGLMNVHQLMHQQQLAMMQHSINMQLAKNAR